ncbi:MAG: hypothetical protein ACOCWM_04065, partial [Cyclobacteriaceae bacterium]
MKQLRYILLLLFFVLGFFSENLKAEIIILENEKIESFSEQNFQEQTSDVKYLGLLYLQKESSSQNQIIDPNQSLESSFQNFSESLCPKNITKHSQSSFQTVENSKIHRKNGRWLETVLHRNPELVDSWKTIGDLGDNAFDQLKKDPDFLEQFDGVVKNDGLNKHVFDGEVTPRIDKETGQQKVAPDGTLQWNVSGAHTVDALDPNKLRIKGNTTPPNPGNNDFYSARIEA